MSQSLTELAALAGKALRNYRPAPKRVHVVTLANCPICKGVHRIRHGSNQT